MFGEAVLVRREVRITDFAFDLTGFPVVAVKIRLRGSAAGADAVRWDITGFTADNRLDGLAITIGKVRDEELPIPFIVVDEDFGKFINFEFLILGGMGIIKSPLFERDISADKVDEPAILLVKILNYGK